MKKLLLILALLLVMTSLYGCSNKSFEYEGDYLDLYTEALYSIPGTKGFIQSEIRFDPEITIIEYDDYGRVLFVYYEGNDISTYSLLVMQYSNENEACFYSTNSYISSSGNEFDENDILKLKEDNDWNNEIIQANCSCEQINASKKTSPLSYEQIRPFYELVFPDDEHFSDDRTLEYYLTDEYGRVLIVAEARFSNQWAVMLFNPDATYDSDNGYHIFTDFYTYQNDLTDFKELNHWNEPFE